MGSSAENFPAAVAGYGIVLHGFLLHLIEVAELVVQRSSNCSLQSPVVGRRLFVFKHTGISKNRAAKRCFLHCGARIKAGICFPAPLLLIVKHLRVGPAWDPRDPRRTRVTSPY